MPELKHILHVLAACTAWVDYTQTLSPDLGFIVEEGTHMGIWMDLSCSIAFRRAKDPGYSGSSAQHPFTSNRLE